MQTFKKLPTQAPNKVAKPAKSRKKKRISRSLIRVYTHSLKLALSYLFGDCFINPYFVSQVVHARSLICWRKQNRGFGLKR